MFLHGFKDDPVNQVWRRDVLPLWLVWESRVGIGLVLDQQLVVSHLFLVLLDFFLPLVDCENMRIVLLEWL